MDNSTLICFVIIVLVIVGTIIVLNNKHKTKYHIANTIAGIGLLYIIIATWLAISVQFTTDNIIPNKFFQSVINFAKQYQSQLLINAGIIAIVDALYYFKVVRPLRDR